MDNDANIRRWARALIPGAGVSLHAVSAGAGPTLLFLHGFPEFWYAWKAQLAALSARSQAVALDLRGYGWSDKPARVDDYALPVLVADIVAALDHLSPGRPATLVGHDWGGVLAWAVASARPERLDRLVIINAPHPALFARELRENPAQRRASSYMPLFRSPLAEPLLRAGGFALLRAIVFGLAAPGAFSAADRRAYRRAWAQTGALTGGLNYYRALRPGAGGTGSVGPIAVPTLVIWGERDTALLAGSLDGLDALVPDLRIARLPGGTHWVVHEQPAAINRLIQDFLEAETGGD